MVAYILIDGKVLDWHSVNWVMMLYLIKMASRAMILTKRVQIACMAVWTRIIPMLLRSF